MGRFKGSMENFENMYLKTKARNLVKDNTFIDGYKDFEL